MSDVNGRPEVTDLQTDIERTREDLAHTVDQLAAKLDVKSRVGDRVAETKDVAASHVRSARDRAIGPDGKPTPVSLSVAGIVAVAAAVVLVRAWRRRH